MAFSTILLLKFHCLRIFEFQIRLEFQLWGCLQFSDLHYSLKVSIINELRNSWPFILAYLKAVQNKFFDLIAYIIFELPPLQLFNDTISKLLFSLAIVEGCFAMIEFIDHDSECPDISLGPIHVIQNALGRHIERRPDIEVSKIDST